MDTTAPHTVYRLYDAEGRLLYVGMTNNLPRRLEQHARKPWWARVARTDLQQEPNRGAAMRAEAEAIRTERPAYNTLPTAPRTPREEGKIKPPPRWAGRRRRK